jgi:hypothetical protein
MGSLYLWQEKGDGSPKIFTGQVPIIQIIKEYIHQADEGTLRVSREFRPFASPQETTTARYEDTSGYKEAVHITNGEITGVEENLKKYIDRRINWPEDADELVEFWWENWDDTTNVKQRGIRSYCNIKKCETPLRKLPWQHDLQAIYEGSGLFLEPEEEET